MEEKNLPGKKIIEFMNSSGFRIRALNIIYLVGASADDWKPAENTMDEWNDARCVIRNCGEVLGSWQATTDPGEYYEENLTDGASSRGGCSILALGQHKDAWELGLMHDQYPALTQCDDITIYVDRSGDGKRYGHTCQVGAEAGINHHGCNGMDGGDSVGRWSAGCQVGKYWESHEQFIQICRDSGNATFDATLLDGAKVWEWLNK